MADIPGRLAAAFADRYDIVRELGSGGMATVYLATDLKHDRKVALKVLKPELAAVVGGDRFVSEIKTTANLQHPHILPLFDSGEADGFLFYVMPYVEGETLRERLDRERQLPVGEAVAIATKIAGALQAAHDEGVIHRDIKPANILLQKGEPVVSDFGIALAIQEAGGGRLTETGLSIGTPYYMSPEQATADRDPDARSDLYSLACLTYEMLAGEPPFTGSSAQAVLGRILTQPPPHVSAERSSVPHNVNAAILQALQKVPADRFASVAAFADALNDLSYMGPAGRASGAVPAPPASPGSAARSSALPWALFAVASAVAVFALVAPPPSGDAGLPIVLDLEILRDLEPADGYGLTPALSPDGRRIAVAASRDGREGIYLRDLDQPRFRLVPGTEGGGGPEFSPDGEWLAFVRGGGLYRVPLSGGGVTTLLESDTIGVSWAHWGTRDRIAVAGPEGTRLVSATSGAIEDVRKVADVGSYGVHLLPNGRGVLSHGLRDTEGIRVHDVDHDTTISLLPTGRFPKYVEPGYLLYVGGDQALYAVRFDADSFELSGTPVRLVDRIGGGLDFYSVSANGTLFYGDGPPSTPAENTAIRTMRLEDARIERVALPRSAYEGLAYSPSGRWLAFGDTPESTREQLYTFDLRTQVLQRITGDAQGRAPVWSPDEDFVVYQAVPEYRLFAVRPDGAGEPVDLGEETLALWPTHWVQGDRILAYRAGDAGGAYDVFVVHLGRTGSGLEVDSVTPYLRAPYGERNARLSPDGSRVVFESLRTGAVEIWVASFPEPTVQYRVTSRPGEVGRPRWTADGRAILVPSENVLVDTLFAIDVPPDDELDGVPEPRVVGVFDSFFENEWDLAPTGAEVAFLFNEAALELRDGIEATGEDPRVRFHLVVDWRNELERRMEEAGR